MENKGIEPPNVDVLFLFDGLGKLLNKYQKKISAFDFVSSTLFWVLHVSRDLALDKKQWKDVIELMFNDAVKKLEGFDEEKPRDTNSDVGGDV